MKVGIQAVLVGVLVRLLVFGGYGGAWAGEGARKPVAARLYHIGYRILKVPREGQEPLVVALWYPTEEGPGRMSYRVVASEMVSDATRDAAPARGSFPLVIYSHGGGGCAIMGVTHAEALAESGFVVAGPDHNDAFIVARSDSDVPPDPARVRDWFSWARGVSSGMQRGKPGGKFAHRPAEVRAAIDYLLKESADPRSALRGLVDPQEIGIMGVSFGAWTTEAVSGFISSIPSFRDERIKAAAPIAGPAQEWRIGSFADIKIPVLIIFGEEETIVLGDRNSGRKTDSMIRDYETANPPKFLVEIKGAQHLDFGGAGVSRREQGGAGGTVSTVDVRNKDRVIATVNHYCIAFFRRYLGGNKSVEKELRTPGPNTVLLKYETGAR